MLKFIIAALLLSACSAQSASASMAVDRTETATVCHSYGLNVRESASTDSAVVEVLEDGTVVELTGASAQPVVTVWYEIRTPVRGWVSGKYLC